MTDHNLEASVLMNLDGNLRQQALRNEKAMRDMSQNGSRHLTGLQRTTKFLDRSISRMGNRWVALATGGSMVAAGKGVVDFDAKLTRMQTSVRMSDEQLAKLKASLLSVANDENVRVPIDQLTGAVAQFLDKTGDTDYAIDQLQNVGFMMQGLGIEAQSAGLLLAQFWEDGIRNPDDVIKTLDRLFAQFSRGSVPVKDIARVSAELFSTVQRQGPEAIAEIGALAQVYAKTAGNADKAQTALKATVRVLNDSKKAATIDAALAKHGLDPIREASGLIRALPQLLLDITRVANNSVPMLSTVFDGEALDGLKALVDDKNKALLNEMLNGVVERDMTLTASTKNAATASAAMDSLTNAAQRFADINLAGPIEDLADAINGLDDSRLVELMESAKEVAFALGGLFVGHKVLNAGTAIRKSAKANRGTTNDLMNGASMSAPIPVFVVNQIGGTGAIDTPTGNSISAKNKPSKMMRIAENTGKAFNVLGAGSMGYAAGTILNEFIDGTAVGDWVGASTARIMSALGDDDAKKAVIANGDAHPIYGPFKTPDSTDELKKDKKLTVELSLTADAAKALTPNKKTGTDKNTRLDITGGFGTNMSEVY